jgi:catalase
VVSFKGGAPNYYPNSFSAPQEQRSALEHGSHCSSEVKRFNSANEDNVTQVMASLSAVEVTC